ncbi:MAG TPA: VOC family protein [Nannocystaceae bacterium]|nr:VOC family protein [Nannocystaceae bacterium]
MLATSMVGCSATAGDAAPPIHAAQASAVSHVVLTVSALDEAERWFAQHVDAAPLERFAFSDDGTRWNLGPQRGEAITLAIGAQRIVLIDFDGTAPLASAPATSNDARFQHLALVVGDIDARWAELRDAIVPVSPAPQRIPDDNVAAAGIRAAYFRGPDAHPLELIWYPRDKGAVTWHRDGDRVLGIDHSAVVVADTQRSLAFYRDLLGLEVVGGSVNEGVEQARLSGVDGARVRITALRGPNGPGVELLEYVAPGLAFSGNSPTRADDPAHAETTIAVADLDDTIVKLRDAGVRMSSRATSPCIGCSDDARAFVVADPDGHAVQLVQSQEQ